MSQTQPVDAKPVRNSIVKALYQSHGSFGRFLRLVHGKHSTVESGPRTPLGKGQSFQLFPSFLVVPVEGVTSNSARSRARGRGRESSWELLDVIWKLFTFLEGGSPSSDADQLALANRASACAWTTQHAHFAGSMHAQIREFIRLQMPETLSRGTQKLSELIESIRSTNSSYKPGPYSIEELMQGAKFVKPDRMSLPSVAGILDPKDFLKGDNLEAFVNMPWQVPHDIPPVRPTKGCFKVTPEDVRPVYKKLLDSGVAVLIPASLALRNEQGEIISGGLFAVDHKEATDRVILDRRPMNELERRMVMARLPHGCLFTQLIIPKHCSVRASGDDISNYFYLLKHHEEWLGRNTVGRPVSGKDFREYGCDPEEAYMLSFKVIAMGDSNAVDLAQETHFQILRDADCLDPDETVAFKSRLPSKPTWEGLYIDDHIVAQILPKRKCRNGKKKFRDEEIIERSREKYKALGLPVSEKKQFTKVENFVAWGTSVNSRSGRVGTPLAKLRQLSQLILDVCALPKVTQKLMQKIVGLLIHPAMHRRIFMCLLQETYIWIEKFKNNETKKMPPVVKEELLWMGICLPLMHSNARWPVSKRVGATDASTTGGGRAATGTSQNVADTLYRFAEHRGEACRLDWETGYLAPPSSMNGAPEELESLMGAHVWNTTHKCTFGHKQHINILEMKMLKAELKDLVKHHADPYRAVVLCDSRVVCGAYAKGRSSSKQLNRILRSMLGWGVVGQKSLHLVWVQSKANPSDHPSRGRPIPEPPVDDPIIEKTLGCKMPELQHRKSNREIHKLVRDQHKVSDEFSQANEINNLRNKVTSPSSHPAIGHWTFREIFAGKGCLTKAFRNQGQFRVGSPVEILQRGKPCEAHDLLCDKTFNKLCAEAQKPKQIWHFGLPCGSFSIMQNMNKGSRTADNPAGNGSVARELLGNELLSRTVYLCRLLHQAGNFFTIENPRGSFAWKMPKMEDLLKRTRAERVHLDQCCYGLKIPGMNGLPGLARKNTTFAGTLPTISHLAATCSKDHDHVHVIGGVKVGKKRTRRSELAGAYPTALCQTYHRCCSKLFM